MNTLRTLFLSASLYLSGLTVVSAQNTVFTYQGRVRVSGSDFSGTGQFKFALVTSTNHNHRATATANLSGSFVVGYNVTFGGNGYLSAPAVTVSGGGGSGATAHSVISGGVVTAVIPDSAGSGYTIAPTVTIAPPPSDISFTTFWSNDGTSVAGSEPSAAVGIPVFGGLFTVVLGDSSLVNMSPIDASVFLNPNLQLRIWFNDGMSGFAALDPPQSLTPTPYAVVASSLSGIVSSANLGGTYANPINLNNGGNTFSGTFAGNGGTLSNLSVNSLVAPLTNISITTWGDSRLGQRLVPSDLGDVIALSAGFGHSLALKLNSTVVAWGAGTTNEPSNGDDFGQSIIPLGLTATAVAAGFTHSLALKTDGTVIAWGDNSANQTNVPVGLNGVKAIAAGFHHSLALKTDGTVVAFGTNDFGQLPIPPGLSSVMAIAAGEAHSLALRSNGTVVAWGAGLTNGPGNGIDRGQSIVPVGLSNVIAISAGGAHSLALKADGTVVAWGAGQTNDPNNGFDFGQALVPVGLSNVTAIVAGLAHSLALKIDGTVVAWGDNQVGETEVPQGLNNVVALAPGSLAAHVMVLRKRAQSPVAWLDSDNTFNGNIQVNGDLHASGDATLGGDLRLNEGNLWLRGGNDRSNGLGWFGGTKSFGGFSSPAPDGPVLFGFGGGGLGITTNNQQRIALAWDSLQRVGIGTATPSARLSLGSDSAASKLLLFDNGAGGAGLGFTNSEFRLHLPGTGKFAFLSAPNGGEVVSILAGGNVGIGTTSPNRKLVVAGDIGLGSGGSLLAPGAVENLRILRGRIAGNGTVSTGSGFTVSRTGTGAYTVTFTTAFFTEPSVTATAQVIGARIVTCTSVLLGSAGFRTFDSTTGTAVDQDFQFIAIGPR